MSNSFAKEPVLSFKLFENLFVKIKKSIRRILWITFSVVAGILLLVVVFVSPLAKYLVEKYDEKYTGRQVRMDWAYVNPFTGYFHFRNFRVYESPHSTVGAHPDSVFFSSDDLSIKFSLFKLFSKTYEIKGLILDNPRLKIIQDQTKKEINFMDMIDKFRGDSTKEDNNKAPLHFNLLNFEVNGGTVYYSERVIPIDYFIKDFYFESEGLRWDVDTVSGKFSFKAGVGSGEIMSDFTYNIKKSKYRLKATVRKFDMNIIQQYLKDLSNYGTVRAFFDADVSASGDFNDAEAVDARGHLRLSDFHFGKNPKQDYASFDEFKMEIVRVSPSNKIYHYDTIALKHPFFSYEKYDQLDNIQNMFGKGGENVKKANADPTHFNLILEIARYVERLGKNFFRSHYKVNRLEIDKADLRFADYSTSEKFFIAANPLSIESDSIDKRRMQAKIVLKTGIRPYGYAGISLRMNPKDSSDFDLDYRMEKIPVSMFNPYFITYTSFPMDRGSAELKGSWHVRNGSIESENHLVVLDPRIAKRVKRNDTKWIPMPLIMAFVRERGNVIDYEIPITGNLKDPKFRIRDVLLDLLANIFIKPATVPYGIKVSEVEKKIEKTLTFKWEMRQRHPRAEQERFLEKMAAFLEKTPGASVTITPMQYTAKEKEYILLYEARKKYYIESNRRDPRAFYEIDSTTVAKMPVKDPDFIKYLDRKAGKRMFFTIQEKCNHLVGDQAVSDALKQLAQSRESNFMSYFKKNGTENRVILEKSRDVVPFNGFSYFRIGYKGDIPDELRKAFEEMEQLDEESPRNKYFKERKKIRDFFKLSKQ